MNPLHTKFVVQDFIRLLSKAIWTTSREHFYIGDVGNNKGTRKFIQIHTVPKQHIKNEDNVICHLLQKSIKEFDL